VIQGDADEVVDHEQTRAWAARHPPSLAYRSLAGCGHFFHGFLPQLREIVKEWAQGGA
jgi:alpha/beta superfamily hydrolase